MLEASSSRVPGLGEDSKVTVEVDDLEILDFDQLAGQLIEDACEDVCHGSDGKVPDSAVMTTRAGSILVMDYS
jgi:hypothetical protein